MLLSRATYLDGKLKSASQSSVGRQFRFEREYRKSVGQTLTGVYRWPHDFAGTRPGRVLCFETKDGVPINVYFSVATW